MVIRATSILAFKAIDHPVINNTKNQDLGLVIPKSKDRVFQLQPIKVFN